MKKVLLLSVLLSCLFANGQESLNAISHDSRIRHNVYVNYSPMSFNRYQPWIEEEDEYSIGDDSVRNFNIPMNGFGIGYAFYYPILKSIPLYVSVGVNFNYSLGSKKYLDKSTGTVEQWKREIKYGFISIPVNLEYGFNISDVSVSQQIGIGSKINCFFREIYYRNMTDKTIEYGMNKTLYPDDFPLSKDKKHNLYQLYGEMGLTISYKKWFVGCSYCFDLNHFEEDKIYIIDGNTGTSNNLEEKITVDYNTFQIRLGYSF